MSGIIFQLACRRYYCFMKTASIKHLKFAHNAWLRAIEFYKLELHILQERLEEIAFDNTGKEVSEGIEHYQNQLIIHRDYLDGLAHRIKTNVREAESEITQSSGNVSESTVLVHDELAEQYHTEENMINQLRHEFNRFASKWM